VQGLELNTLAFGRSTSAFAVGGQLFHMLGHHLGKLRRLGDGVHQTPIHGFLTANAFDAGAKNIRMVVAHMALVGHAGSNLPCRVARPTAVLQARTRWKSGHLPTRSRHRPRPVHSRLLRMRH
jgi:hypothetical protein